MRLLRTDKLEIEEFGFDQIPKYAILSHRWGKYELTLQDIQGRIWTKERFGNENAKLKAQKKVQQCCRKAQADLFEYIWIDSCCIDKTSSAELSEAINSMYLWYYKAAKCYAYLVDAQSVSDVIKSEWFTRGWTLQELLAPPEVYFVNENWEDLGTKTSLRQAISDQTRIPVSILSGADLETASIAQRMSWASHRKTTRIEDRAYCLMGIFGINMPLLYGEGERAFIRLQEEIMKIADDHSLFAWRSSDTRGGLLATSPDAFVGSSNIVQYNPFRGSVGPLTVSSRGVHLELRFIGRGPGGLGMAILHCREGDGEEKPLAIYLRDITWTMEIFERVLSETFEYIDLRKFRPSQYPIRKICVRMGRMSIASTSESSMRQSRVIKEIYPEATVNDLMRNGTQQLFYAAYIGDQDLAWFLLTINDIKADSKDERGRTALCHAVLGCHVALIEMLLSRRDIDAENKDIDGRTPLLLAVCGGFEGIVKLLVERGADTEVVDKFNRTPLHQAVRDDHENIVKLLVENGAAIPLWVIKEAAHRGNESIITILVEKGADIEMEYEGSCTMLSWAVNQGYLTLVKVLIKKGAKLETKDHDGLTPLFLAVENRDLPVVELLLEKGAEFEVEDCKGRSPLFRAIRFAHKGIIRALTEKGARSYSLRKKTTSLRRKIKD